MPRISHKAIQMDPPILGYEDINTYTLQSVPDNPYFFWLEAKSGPKFLLAKPEYFFPDYLQQVKSFFLSNVNVVDSEEKFPDVYVIITVPERVMDMTANLLAPLLINHNQKAGQFVIYDSDFQTRHFLFPPEKRSNCG